jgi:hypothetical protein
VTRKDNHPDQERETFWAFRPPEFIGWLLLAGALGAAVCAVFLI